MKNRFLYLLFLGFCLMFIPGCGNGNFFDIQSAMSPPRLEQDQEKVKVAVKEHFGEDITWKYPLIDGKYAPVTKVNLTNSSEVWYMVFCQTHEENHRVHMLFLKQDQGKWNVFEDVAHAVLDIEKVYIQDIDKDGVNEAVVFAKSSEDSYNSIYAYKYKDNNVSEVTIPDSFWQGKLKSRHIK